jgi:hypothetical protein
MVLVLAAELAAGSDPQKRERAVAGSERSRSIQEATITRAGYVQWDLSDCPRAVAAARVVTSAGRGEECGEGGQRLLDQRAKPARAGTGSLWLTITVFAGEWHDSIETSTS